MTWIGGPLAGAVTTVVAIGWARWARRRELGPWETLLRPSSGDTGHAAVEGRAGGDTHLEAPFSRRRCLAYHAEIVVREELGSAVRWRRVFEEGAGEVKLALAGGGEARVDYTDGTVVAAPPVETYAALPPKRPETVYEGIPRLLPTHLESYVLGALAEDPRATFFAAGRVFFDERVVVAGDPIVACGPSARDADGVLVIAPDPSNVVALGFGTLATERRRVASATTSLPLVPALLAGLVVGTVVEMLVAMATRP